MTDEDRCALTWVAGLASHATQTVAKTTNAEAKRVAWSSLSIDLIHPSGGTANL
jgi:hypothetical protein